ncbi:hypothetical protein J6590_087658 [Homalodisca vitripennis]|nr:hypothetical protein J6590_091289 [Homalodisca vitripennis]KAG8329380.1 hypothetical protein J6590_087658 [Homalodisca vitripennis]
MFSTCARKYSKFLEVCNTLRDLTGVCNWCHLSDVTQAANETTQIITQTLELFLMQLVVQTVEFSTRGYLQISRQLLTTIAALVTTEQHPTRCVYKAPDIQIHSAGVNASLLFTVSSPLRTYTLHINNYEKDADCRNGGRTNNSTCLVPRNKEHMLDVQNACPLLLSLLDHD